jgi:exopolysaccharide biosynthesis polyprenyl glycosylphosphotransferase
VTDELAGIPVTTVHTGAMQGWPVVVKRVLDVTLSMFLLATLFPLLVLVGAAIKFTSPGPILFVQERVGLNKRHFHLYKFRTMVPQAELAQSALRHLNEASGPVFKIRSDPRVTPIGRVLRRTSIDELPQLFNVLTGDMSMVGPRPLPIRDYEGFDEDRHRRRFSVRPGLTCLWQVSGRHLIPFESWMALDLHYIDHWSLWLDIKTMLRTIPAVIRGSGAS